MLDSVIDFKEVVTITTKKGNAVLLSLDDYNSMIETAYINSIPGLASDIIKAGETPLSECVKMNKIDWDKVDEF